MTVLKGNCLVAQSGGPTSVINASVVGVVQEAFRSGEIDRVYGALNGVAGILNENLICFNDEPAEEIELMRVTPAAALGSCRFKLKGIEENESEFKRILEGPEGFLWAHWCGLAECEAKIKEETKATIRAIPFQEGEGGKCIRCGEASVQRVVFAKAY